MFPHPHIPVYPLQILHLAKQIDACVIQAVFSFAALTTSAEINSNSANGFCADTRL